MTYKSHNTQTSDTEQVILQVS